jgi:hypothetical protein
VLRNNRSADELDSDTPIPFKKRVKSDNPPTSSPNHEYDDRSARQRALDAEKPPYRRDWIGKYRSPMPKSYHESPEHQSRPGSSSKVTNKGKAGTRGRDDQLLDQSTSTESPENGGTINSPGYDAEIDESSNIGDVHGQMSLRSIRRGESEHSRGNRKNTGRMCSIAHEAELTSQ